MTFVRSWSSKVVRPSDWASRNIVIPSGEPRPGRLILDPYQQPILDAFMGPHRRVVMQVNSQFGKTLIVQCAVGYCIDELPCPIMICNPRESDNQIFRANKLEPFLRTSLFDGRVAQKGKPSTGEFNQQLIRFNGGLLMFANSGSEASMRQRTCRLVFADEIDTYEGIQNHNYNPLDILAQRTVQYGGRGKLIMLSTPSNIVRSLIEEEYMSSNMQKWYVTCECDPDKPFVFMWDEHVEIFEQDGIKDAYLHCPKGCIIDEKRRRYMTSRGRYIAEAPDKTFSTGFYFNQLSSMLTPFEATKQHGLHNADGRGADFRNQVLALPALMDQVESVSPTALDAAATTTYPFCDGIDENGVPIDNRGYMVTAGVDVQGDRLEYSICVWTRQDELYVFKHGVEPYGKTEGALERAFDRVDVILDDAYVDLTFVDAAFMPDEVKDAIKYMRNANRYIQLQRDDKVKREPGVRSIMGYKGDSFNRPYMTSESRGTMTLAVDQLKLSLKEIINLGRFKYNELNVPENYLKQIQSEELTKDKNGKPFWNRTYRHNEAWDCAVYALAAMRHIDANTDYWDSGHAITLGL